MELGGTFGLGLSLVRVGRPFSLLAVYRTHGSEPSLMLANYYESNDKGKTHILVGDMDLNLLSPDLKTEYYIDVLSTLGFVKYIDKPTSH